MATVRILDEPTIRGLIDPEAARLAVAEAFRRLYAGEVSLPAILDLEFPDREGEAHVKGAHLHGSALWSVKVATGFYRNRELGLPNSQGLSLAFSAQDGSLRGLLFDNGWLTELRTGAAGGLAAELLAPEQVGDVLLVGTGEQTRYQLQALLLVRTPQRVRVWGRRHEAAVERAAALAAEFGLDIQATEDLAAATRAADVIVTATASREPVLDASMISPGTHITAMGSDFAGKQELDPALLARADVLVADDPPTAAGSGEVRAAVAAGAIRLDGVVPLGAIASGAAPGRTSEDQITIADLVGLGIQDAAVAAIVVEAAERDDLGTVHPL